MSSDFSDMEDYECKKNSKCPRHNIFEDMSDEEIKNLFNDKEEEKEEEKSTARKFLENPNEYILGYNYSTADTNNIFIPTNELDIIEKECPVLYKQLFSLPDANFTRSVQSGKDTNKILDKFRFCSPDELVEKLSEYRPFTSNLPDDIVPLPHEDFLGYNPTEYPELDKALKDTKDLVKPEKDLDLNTLPPDEDDIPSGVNYGKCGGIKNDMNKPQLSLVPMQMVRDAALARMYGNNKYKDVPGYSSNNWCTIDKQRVIDALLRHILLYLEDMDGVDSESGLPHLCHVAANLSFLCEMQQPNWEEKKNKIIDNDPILSKSKSKE